MGNLKINTSGSIDSSDFDVIPDKIEDNTKVEQKDSYVKKQEEAPARKMFANKKANIAFIVIGAILLVGTIGAFIFVNLV